MLAASFSALGTFLLSILVWRLAVCYRLRRKVSKEKFAARPFYARTNPASTRQTPRTPYDGRAGSRRRMQEDSIDDDIASLKRAFSQTIPRAADIRRTEGMRRLANGRAHGPPSDIEFAHSRESSGVDDAHHHYRGHSYEDDFGISHPDEEELLAYARRAPHSPNGSLPGSSVSTSPTVVRDRDSVSMHVTAPPSPADFAAEDGFSTPLPVTLPLRVNSRRRERERERTDPQPRRRRSIEKPPLEELERQLAVLESSSRAARHAEMRLVGSPVVSLPSATTTSRPSTVTGTGTGPLSLRPRPLPHPPVPPLPMHVRVPFGSPGRGEFDPGDIGLGLPPPYRLLDLH